MLQRSRPSPRMLGETNPFTLAIGLGVLAIDRRLGADRRANSRRVDRAGRWRAWPPRCSGWRPRRQRSRHRLRRAAGDRGAGYRVQPLAEPGIAQPDHRDRRDGADGGDDALLSVRSPTSRRMSTATFVGVGVGSVLSGLIGAFPVNASPPRTAVVGETGGQSQLAGLAAAAILAALLAFGAALLVEFRTRRSAACCCSSRCGSSASARSPRSTGSRCGEFLLIVATAAAIIVLPIEQGVGIGIALSLLHGIWSTTRARVILFERVPGTSIWWPASPHHPGEHEPGVVVAGFQAPLSFLNAYSLPARRPGRPAIAAPSRTAVGAGGHAALSRSISPPRRSCGT